LVIAMMNLPYGFLEMKKFAWHMVAEKLPVC
jgi:hypothetical protein